MGKRNVLKLLKHLFSSLVNRKEARVSFTHVFEHFQDLLEDHQRAMELIADLGEKSGGDYIFDRKYLSDAVQDLQHLMLRMSKGLNFISSDRYLALYSAIERVFSPIAADLRGRLTVADAPYVISLRDAPLDTPELIGGKASTLAEIRRRLNIRVPAGFVITTAAYRRFLAHNTLEERIHNCLESWVSGGGDVGHTATQIRYSILAGVVPQDVAREVKRHAAAFQARFAVRSSAFGEDGELSFAGLHESHLNVPRQDLLETYKKVLASLYSPEALVYRMRFGMLGEEAAMAVICQEMVPSQASGIIHTMALAEKEKECSSVYSSFGLGRIVVEGRTSVDRFLVDRKPPHVVMSDQIANKEYLFKPAVTGGEERIPVDVPRQMDASLPRDCVSDLVKTGLTIERYFKRPQEIEWAVDSEGTSHIVQSRGLVASGADVSPAERVCDSCAAYPILIKDKGVVAHGGIGSGPVHLVRSDDDMAGFPDGAVLVARYTAPWLAQIVPRASAIIAESGSPAGHLATIAREFRVPTLVGVEAATVLLQNGVEVTLDTHERVIYEGNVKELLQYQLVESTVFEDAPEFRLLRRLLKRLAPLNLDEPHAPEFTSDGCKTVHDLIRFIHEKAVQELMDLPSMMKRFRGAKVWTLISEVPMGLKIMDMGEGIDPQATGERVTIEQVRSLPFLALWRGISEPGAWSTEPVAVDLKGLVSSLTRNWAAMDPSTLSGANLAVIKRTYMNLNLRLGYHFNLIDARMSDEPHHNHIYFRFVGGVTDMTRRSRRSQVLAKILSHYNFKVTIKGDMVVAGILHLPKTEIERRLFTLGTLIGFTRQLDMQMKSEPDIDRFVDIYFSSHEETLEAASGGGAP